MSRGLDAAGLLARGRALVARPFVDEAELEAAEADFAQALVLQPGCVMGYVAEVLKLRKQWGTK